MVVVVGIVIITVLVIVVVILLKRLGRAEGTIIISNNLSSINHNKTFFSESTIVGLELTEKGYVPPHVILSRHTCSVCYRDPDKLSTASNVSYDTVRGSGGKKGVIESEYEETERPPLPTRSSQPPTAAAGDSLYEPV